MRHKPCDKMVIAIIQGSDYQLVIDTLNENGFTVTILNSTGGFLKKQSVTIMLGLNHEDLEDALNVLRSYGQRTEMRCSTSASGTLGMLSMAPMAVPMVCGGVIIFILDVAGYERH